ncbi:MAG: T9SS type A sorting domain-containing protein [Flavobacteriales bacterium]|nr:T9SS type A sorting domain-containing protein [Flavobacteriales bacterium]
MRSLRRGLLPPLLLVIMALALTQVLRAQRLVPIGSGIGSQGVFDMEEYAGKLIIAGRYPTFNDHARANIQGWDGTQHTDLPGAFESIGEKVVALDLWNGELVAAGIEAAFGNIAKWDGSQWSGLGNGLSNQVLDMVVWNNEVVIAEQGGVVRKWDGQTWVQLGSGFNGQLHCLEVHAGELYVGGAFSQEYGTLSPMYNLAKWNGTAWEQVLTGLNARVRAMLSTPSGLVIGGDFTSDATILTTLPYWTILNAGAFIEPPPDTEAVTIGGLCAMPSGGFLVSALQSSRSLWVNGSDTVMLSVGGVRTSFEHAGRLFLGGAFVYGSYAPCSSIAEVVDGQDQVKLETEDISASCNPSSRGFHDLLSNRAGFEVPKGNGTHTIFGTLPALIGEQYGVLHALGIRYVASSPVAGPLANVMDDQFYRRYHQVWKVSLNVIQEHVTHWNDPGYETPSVIASWPGNGDTQNGEPAQLAPYADLNGNGTYEPGSGEYPLIRGDEAVYRLMHATYTIDSLYPPIPLDIHIMDHVFHDAPGSDLSQTVFTQYRVVNRSQTSLEQVRFGLYMDTDIGSADDDYVECDSLLGMFFGFNGDPLDENSQVMGYGPYPPAQGALFLNQYMSAFSYIGSSTSLLDAIQGTLNGQPHQFGNITTNFMFPGGMYTEASAGNQPFDRRSMGSCGPFTLDPGGELCIDLAFPYARAFAGGPYASVLDLKARSQVIKDFYGAHGVQCGTYPDEVNSIAEGSEAQDLSAFPNPASGLVVLERRNGAGDATIQLFNGLGSVVRNEQWPSGAQRIPVDLSDQAPGLYFAVISAEQARHVVRIVLE